MKLLLLFTLTCFLSSPLFAQQTVVSGKINSGSIAFASGLSYDFGQIKQNKPVTHTFTFTHSGKESILIINVKPGCNCTTAEYTKDAVLSGQSGVIKVIYNAYTAGKFSKPVTVNTDHGETFILNVSGEVIQ